MIYAAFIGTFVPLLFLFFVLRHSRPVIGVFLWGMLSFLIAGYVNTALAGSIGQSLDQQMLTVIIAPPVEELLKMLPLLYFLFFAQKSFVPFIYILGMAAGIGFAIEENLLYLLAHAGSFVSPVLYMTTRSVSTCLMHGMTTALVGFSFTYIRKHGRYAVAFAPVAYLCAVAAHGLYNLIICSRLSIIGLMMTALVYLAGMLTMRYHAERMPEAADTSWQK